MTDQELKGLNQKLWHAADQLRAGAHLSANMYGQPILGLVFLRDADILGNAIRLGRLGQLRRLGRGRSGLCCRSRLSNRGRKALDG